MNESRNESFLKNASKIAIKEVVDTLIQGEESSGSSADEEEKIEMLRFEFENSRDEPGSPLIKENGS